MRVLTKGLTIFIILLLFSGCQKNIQTMEVLRPNWSEATLKVTGIAKIQNGDAADRLMSLQKAKSDAFKKLKEELLNIMITDTKTISEYIKDKEAVKGQVEDFIKEERLQKSGTFLLIITLRLILSFIWAKGLNQSS